MDNEKNTYLSTEDIANAKGAVDTYKNTCEELLGQITTIINRLTGAGAGFNGDASEGYNTYYQSIQKSLTDQLLADKGSFTASVKQILDDIEKSFLQDVDPKLKNANIEVAGEPTIKTNE